MKALYFENDLLRIMALKATSKLNRLAALGPLSPLRYEEVPEPSLPNERWVKVRNLACGLCGTDIHFMFMEMDPKSFPAALPGIKKKYLGHELVGRVVEAGTESGFVVGNRVVMRLDWPSCAQLEIERPCRQCAEGNYMLCENLGIGRLPDGAVGGGFSPFMVMHRSQPCLVPDALSDDQALLLEPTACAVHGVGKASFRAGDKVLVIGGGTIGLLTASVIGHRHPEVTVHCLVRYPYQAEAACEVGARAILSGKGNYQTVASATAGRALSGYFGNEIVLGGYDTIFDTVGNDASLHDALRWVRGRGRVVLMGINFMPGKVDYTTIWNQEIELSGINCHATESDGRNSFEHAAEILQAGRLDPSLILTHRLPMHRWKEAVKLFLNKGASKATKIVLEHP